MSKEIKQFKNWIKALNEYETLLTNNYNKAKTNKKGIDDKGYIINKKIIDDIKQKLSYDELKKYTLDKNKEIIFNKKCEEKFKNKNIQINKCDQKIFNNCQELYKSLNKNNEFIIINYTIWNMVKNGELGENEGLIKYTINSTHLIIYINNANILFKYHYNILSKYSFIKIEYINQNEIDKIFNSIIAYNKFENFLIKYISLNNIKKKRWIFNR